MLDNYNLLVGFLRDYSIADRKDLDGNKIGGYELISSCSVGGNMQSLCKAHLMDTFGRKKLEVAALALRGIEEQYFTPNHPNSWMNPTDLHDAFEIHIQDIARALVKELNKNGESNGNRI